MSLLFDVAGIIFRKQDLERVGWWTLLAGTIGLSLSIFSGLQAEASLEISAAAREHLESHEQIAFVVATTFSILTLWRVAARTSLPSTGRPIFLLLALGGVILMWFGAWYGGELVFEYGTGVKHPLLR